MSVNQSIKIFAYLLIRLEAKSHIRRSHEAWSLVAFEKGLHSSTCTPRGLNCLPRAPGRGDCWLLCLTVLCFCCSIFTQCDICGCWFLSLYCQLPFIFGCSATSTVYSTFSTSIWMIDGENACLNILQVRFYPILS